MTDPQTLVESLGDDAQLVWKTLQTEAEPLDAIAISSLTRLPIERVLSAVDELLTHGLAQRVEAEPVHQRVASAAVA